jgi:hypothetical protein
VIIYGTSYVIEQITPDQRFAVCTTKSLDSTFEEEGLTFGLGLEGRGVKVPIEKILSPSERDELRKVRSLYEKFGTGCNVLKRIYGTSDLARIVEIILNRLIGSKRYAAIKSKSGAMRHTEIRILT